MVTQVGKVRLHWEDDQWEGNAEWMSKDVTINRQLVSGTEAVMLTVRGLHNQENPTPRPQAWWAGSIVGEEGTDVEGAVVGFTVLVRMGAGADQLAGGALEVAEVHWMVVGRVVE